MSSDVVLTTALRNNLLSLKSGQNAQKTGEPSTSKTTTQDSVDIRSSEALPPAQSLSNRASELARVLDGISQSIRTIEAASTALSEVPAILENASNVLEDFSAGGSPQEALTALNVVIESLNTVIESASFKGTNLLKGDDLVTNFTEDGRTTLTTNGEDLSSAGLNITPVIIDDRDTTPITLAAIGKAIDDIAGFEARLQEDLSVIQTRRSFTEGTISSLNAGAGDLDVSDQNEEGANLLALQVRQDLTETDVPLASQAQQSVLRNF